MTENTLNTFSTLALGEEGHTTSIIGEEDFSAHAETERKLHTFSTLALGEEGHTTSIIGEEDFSAHAETERKLHTDADFSRKGGPFGAY